MSDYTPSNQHQQFSGSYEAESRKYHLYTGKQGRRWLVADVRGCGSHVYVEGGPNSDGFGGRTLQFTLIDGTVLSLKGPWHTNSEALFKETGVDVRDQHLGIAVIAMNRKYENGMTLTLTDVIYQDKEPVLDFYGRPSAKVWAQRIADELGHSVMLYHQSFGGSSTGPVNPGNGPYIAPPEEKAP